MKMRRWILIISICLLQGCVYVPPVWDGGDAIHQVDEISEGVSTRTDVLDVLGEPTSDADPGEHRYQGYSSYGMLIFGVAGLIDEDPWYVTITFDDSDYVERIITNLNPWHDPERKKITLQQAEEGSPEAQYEVGKHFSGLLRLEWLCRSAIGGLALASYHLGRHFETMDEPDYSAAYVWQSLAARGELPAARAALERLSSATTGSETTETKHRAASWQPDPDDCHSLIEQERRAIEERKRAVKTKLEQELDRMASLRKPAEKGDVDGQYKLGRHWFCYRA
jgi:hypothetical protein